MLLGALVDAGASLSAVRSAVGALGVEPVEITTRPVAVHGLAAAKADVIASASVTRRTWAGIRSLLDAAELLEPVRARAQDVFARLARAEGHVHGIDPERVHFHEVGALDALADVVGVCAALHDLGVDTVTCSPVALGTGATRGEHGAMPVPAPAVLALLQEARAPVYSTEIRCELCTPTGAALLAATVTSWGGMPPSRVRATGCGAGTRTLAELPNMVRVVVGDLVDAGPEDGSRADMLLLETNIDDMDPRIWPDILAGLIDAGAADAWLTPIVMKKGRPAHTLSALVEGGRAAAVRAAVFAQTSTIGLRERWVSRTVLDREFRTVEVGGRRIRVKVAYLDGAVAGEQPEYDDVSRAADALNRPSREVLADAVAAARRQRA